MKYTPYLTALTMSKDQKQSVTAEAKANETEQVLKLELARLNTRMLQQENDLVGATMEYPLDVNKVRSLQDNLDRSARQQKKLTELVEGLFPTAA